MDAAAALQPVSTEPARRGGGDGGSHREDRLALPGGRVRVLTARGWEDALRRLDHKLHAVNIYTGKARWTFTADGEINSSPAFVNGKVYFETDGGSVYALDARTGRLRWRAQALSRFGRREFFYATPTIAYSVYIGNTDGTLYAFGASSGRLGPARRQLRLHGGRGLAAACLHRYIRRSVHGVQCGDR